MKWSTRMAPTIEVAKRLEDAGIPFEDITMDRSGATATIYFAKSQKAIELSNLQLIAVALGVEGVHVGYSVRQERLCVWVSKWDFPNAGRNT